MADIRIKDLATTASSTASDDFLAVDGSANGTRKLNASSPSFGGNLTVAGGTVTGGSSGLTFASGGTNQNITLTPSGTGIVTSAANITGADFIVGSSGPSVKSSLSARAPRQGLVFDGTAGATVSVPAFGQGTAGNTVNDFTVVGFGFKSALTRNEQIVGGANNSFGLIAKTDGTLVTDLEGFAANSASTGTFTAGKNTMFVYVRSGITGTYYINGVAAGTITDNQNYSVGCTIIGGSTANANSQWTGTLSVLIYNRALSASEVVSLYEAGAPAGADYNNATNTSLITGDNSTFASDTGYWTLAAGATISGGNLNLAGNGSRADRTLPLSVGKKYRAVAVVTANTATDLILGSSTGGSYAILSGTGTLTGDFVASSTSFTIYQNGAGAITVDSITLVPVGLLLAPDAAQAGNGYVWNDQSGNLAQIVLPSSGVQWNLPSVATNRIRGTTSTNGNQQLLGASVLLPAECQITHVRARARTGTPTITIGTASGGAQIVASVALSTTWLNCTIALTGGIVSSADDIWVGSNSTDVVETDIAFQPLDF